MTHLLVQYKCVIGDMSSIKLEEKLSYEHMEKNKSYPAYSAAYLGEFETEERSNSYSFNGPSGKGNVFMASSDPELKRKKRIAAYNVFTAEGKLKSSLRNSFKWIKGKLNEVRYDVCEWLSTNFGNENFLIWSI